MNNQFSTAKAEQCLSPEVLQRLETCTPKTRVGSVVIYSSPSVPSPGRWKLTHTLTLADLETFWWVFLTNQMSWSQSSCISAPLLSAHPPAHSASETPCEPVPLLSLNHGCSLSCSQAFSSVPLSLMGCWGAHFLKSESMKKQLLAEDGANYAIPNATKW